MPYVDPQSIHNPASGTVAPATWGDTVRDDLEFLIDPPFASVSHSTTQSLTSSTQTLLNADTEAFDNNGMHSTVTNNSRLTAQTAGRYILWATITYGGNVSGARRDLRFRVNGTEVASIFRTPPINNAGLGTPLQGSIVAVLGVGDYAEVYGLHDAGVNITAQLAEFTALYVTR